MKIATYNLRFGGRANNRIHWRSLIAQAQPDIFLFQETLAACEYFPAAVDPAQQQSQQQAQQQIHWCAVDGRRWGSAVYVRKGEITPLPPLSEALTGWVCGVKVEGFGEFVENGKGLYIYSVHAPSVKSSYVKQVNLILDGIKAQIPDGSEVVIGGDFNLALGFRHSSEEMQQSEPKLMTRMQREFGLMNCWQMANPNQDLPQTLRWSKDKRLPFHCDGIFAPASWYRYLESAEVLQGEVWDDLSDHNPVVARFEI
ncbi:MAG: endonuclease/exonuclease/phosphatase family protein [Cyanobacteria bacterium J06649_4]